VFGGHVLHRHGCVIQAYGPPSRRQHLHAILLAALCAVLFLRDSLLPGRALVPFPPEVYDVQCAEAQSKGTLDLVDAARGNVGMGDKYNQSLCWDRVLMDRLRAGELPLWTDDIGGGASFVPQMAQVYEPINLLLLVLPSEQWYGWWILLHLVPFGWLAYRFVRQLGCAHASGLLAVVCAVLGLWTQSKLHHNVILTAALPLWPMLSSVLALARGAGARSVGALALWAGVSWLSGFAVVSVQVSYLAVGFALLLCCRNAPGARLRPLLRIAAGLALGAALSLCQMVPVLLAAATSARLQSFDAAHLAEHGLEWDHALTALWPDLLSWAQDRFHVNADARFAFTGPTRIPWSQLVLLRAPIDSHGSPFQNWVETSFAVGLPALACALLALLDRARRQLVWFFGGAALLAFGLATAQQPFLTLARLLPGLAAADLRRTLFTLAMALVVLAALGADRLLERRPRPVLALLAAVLAISAAATTWLETYDDADLVHATAQLIALDASHPKVAGASATAIATSIWENAWPEEPENNLIALTTTAMRAALVAAAALAALLLRRGSWRVGALTALAALELLHAGWGAVQTVPAARVTTPPAVVGPVFAASAEAPGVRPRLQRLVAEAEARVPACYPCNLPGFHRLEDASAYNPLPPARMEEFFTALEPNRDGKVDIAYHGAGVGAFHDPASLRHPLCDLFGIRFVITDQPVAADASLLDRTPPHTGRFRLLERTTWLPRATFVRAVDLLPDAPARLEALRARDRDVAHRVVLEDPDAPVPAPADAAPTEVRIIEHRDQRVVVRVSSPADGYLRLADPYDPGWRATVDAEPSPVYAADHYLRAVHVPAGEHEVVFTFDAPRVVWPPRASLLALLAIGTLLARRPRSAA
jgi:hypothetical protein